MEKTLNMGAFEALDSREMMEVDGGKSPGKVIALVGGTAGIYTGLGLFCAGVATFNPVMAAAGAGLMCTGTATAVQYYN